jgi:hypothetical protein
VGVAAVSDVGPEEIRADLRKIAARLEPIEPDERADIEWAHRIARALATEPAISSNDLMAMRTLVAGMEVPMAAGLMSEILRRMRRMNRR